MVKILIGLLFLVSSCSTVNDASTSSTYYKSKHDLLINELNSSIFEGFYDGDSSKIPTNTYFVPVREKPLTLSQIIKK